MSTENLQQHSSDEIYLTVTPAGCYYAVENCEPTIARELLNTILREKTSPALSEFAERDQDSIREIHKTGFVIFEPQQSSLPEGNLTRLLPKVLPALSERKSVVLTESRQGLFIDYTGVSQDEAEELAVMAAGFRALAEKRNSLLAGKLSIGSRAFGILDPAGNSEIGFWPLHVSGNVFTLIVLGIPRFNTAHFSTLVWALMERYGAEEESSQQ